MTSNKKGSPLSRNIRRRQSLRSRGMILLQTMIMVLILAMIGVMTLKWVLGRYILTTKVSKSINCRALADACLAWKIARWGGVDPANGTQWCGIETANDVRVNISNNPTGGKKIDFVVQDTACSYR